MIDWGSLQDFDDWADALDVLLDEGTGALRANDIDSMVGVQKQLRKFRKQSPNDYCRRLDEIAKQAVLDIAAASLTEGILGIAERSTELDEYVKDINSAASHTRHVAGWLSLSTPSDLARSLVEAERAFSQIKEETEGLIASELKDAFDQQADAVAGAIIELREMLG